MSHPNLEVEHELFMLFRTTFAIHVRTTAGRYELDRSSYGILRLLEEEGPLRLGQIAATYRLDPSTITRQVQTVVREGLAEKQTDPADRRAILLSLTPEGRRAVQAVRGQRGELLGRAMADWSDRERTAFVTSLHRINESLTRLLDT